MWPRCSCIAKNGAVSFVDLYQITSLARIYFCSDEPKERCDVPLRQDLDRAHIANGESCRRLRGRLEIRYRRIGRNELDAIQVCLAFVDAQNKYAEKDRTGEGVGVYAQRIVSSPGKKDGLFWRDDRDPSPLGELAARASSEGYKVDGQGAPYHGYIFRILKGQGSDAPGGAFNYVVKCKKIGGFVLIAYPAEYGNSGVMTFMVNHAGTVYQKDLGKSTEFLARRIGLFDPDQTWKKVDAAKP